ncbi:MAG: alpha/beta fold hydrolase [Pseudomonadota bacterium]
MIIKRRVFTLSRRTLCALATALPATTVAAPFDAARLRNPDVAIDRAFERVGYGQLHFRVAAPRDSAAITRRPVVCFHQTPNSSQVFIEFMAELAIDRRVFAVDTPGLGESDLLQPAPEITDYATAMHQFLVAQQLEEVDVVGYHTGANIAATLGNLAPDRVRGLLLVGLALFNETEREAFIEKPWPRRRQSDGGHLLPEWQSSHRWRGPGQSDESVARTFIEKLSAGNTAWWPARAVMRHDLATELEALTVPTVAVNAGDDLEAITPRVVTVRPDIELITIADAGFGLFETRAAELATLARRVFDDA